MPGIASAFGAGANATYSAIGEQSYANRKERQMLRNDVKQLSNPYAGAVPEAQRNAFLASQQRVGGAQQADQMAQLQRMQAAGGRAGGYDTARVGLAAGQQAGTAAANAGFEQTASQAAQNQRAQVYGRLAAQTGKNTAFWQHQGQIAQDGAENYSGMGDSGGGSKEKPMDWAPDQDKGTATPKYAATDAEAGH